MEKQEILKFFIPFALIASIFSGPVYNFITFFQPNILESHWSIYIIDVMFADLMAISFIFFVVIFLISLKFQDKIIKEPLIISAIMIIGFSCIYASLTWTWEIIILVFVISTIPMAYLIPTLIKVISDKVSREKKDKQYLLVLPLSSLIWIVVSVILFGYVLGSSWRFLYLITGIINIISSFLIMFI